MKIQTSDGIIEVPKVIKYITHNGRKIAIHRGYISNEFTNEFFTSTDYLTGFQIRQEDSISELINITISVLNRFPNYDYSKHLIINE